MLINEKALARQLKEAWRSGGYRVADLDGLMYIAAYTWAITIRTEDIPRKVIGLLAEHLGYLPDDTPVRVHKGMDNQTMILDELTKLFIDLDEGNWYPACATNIIWKDSWRLFQRADHNIHGVDIALLDLLNHAGLKGQEVREDGKATRYCGDEEQTVFLMPMDRKDNLHLDFIEQFDWRLDENGVARVIEHHNAANPQLSLLGEDANEEEVTGEGEED